MYCYSMPFFDCILSAQYLVEEKLKKIKAEKEKVDEPSEITAGLLTYLLSTEMSLEEIHSNISEMKV